ncbi:transmembrane channel-like protein 7 isoform X2 [Mizuhopecten yessoensis]|uniref:transmembrane channel-like protein 7 isoform X2 n=1 Tax=Mizuhopecten yessoensis TaxID=6573 RepID=UPI000B45F6EB|nr:transmembrane channel-like protein 7 isoform X2 [Mizuhopecten yessoensis]
MAERGTWEAGETSPLMVDPDTESAHQKQENMDRRQDFTGVAIDPTFHVNSQQDADGSRYRSDNGDFESHMGHPNSRYSSSEGGATLVRRRKSSRHHGQDGQYEDWDEEESNMLPSLRFQQRSRTKSLKQRHKELQDEHVQSQNNKPQTLRERYAEMKEREEVTAGNLASLMRDKNQDSTLNKMNRSRMLKGTESKMWHKLKRQSKEVLQHFTIWLSVFKEIEGSYGTAIMTYFRFIKWLMFLNLYIMIIMFGVITVPHLALGPYEFQESVSPEVGGYLESVNCTLDYIDYNINYTNSESTFEKVLDVLQGTGWMERKLLFYGVYFNKTYSVGDDTEVYNMSLAYLLAVGASFIISFLLLVKNSAKNVKVTLGIEKTVARYCNKVFGGWDYCIKEDRGANIKRANLKTDIKADLQEQSLKLKLSKQTMKDKCQLYMIRLVINILVLALLGGACYLIAFTTEKMLDLLKKDLSDILALFVQYVPYITITALNLILPIVFQKLVQFERYFHENEIKITLTRSILLRLASPIVLIAILYQQLIGVGGEEDLGRCGNTRWSTSSGGTVKGSVKCWETYVGQQIYKLVLLDLIVETGIVIFVHLPRRLVFNRFSSTSKLIKIIGAQEFSVPINVVDIIYSQILCWLGLFFSPIIPFMTFVKCFLFFYIRKFSLTNSRIEDRPFKTSRSNSLFMTVLLLSFILAALPIGYMIGTIAPSQSCGPFRVYNSTESVMFDTITSTVQRWPPVARDIFYFLGTAGFLVPLIIILCLIMYYYWLLGSGYKRTEKLLQQQLVLEGRDKNYLLGRVKEYQLLQPREDSEDVFDFRQTDVLAGT